MLREIWFGKFDRPRGKFVRPRHSLCSECKTIDKKYVKSNTDKKYLSTPGLAPLFFLYEPSLRNPMVQKDTRSVCLHWARPISRKAALIYLLFLSTSETFRTARNNVHVSDSVCPLYREGAQSDYYV